MLNISGLSCSYGQKSVLHDINLNFPPRLTAIIGPNATGKSTLLKCIAGLLKHHGMITLGGDKIDNKDIPNRISYLPQENAASVALTVLEAVLLGRHQSLSWRIDEENLRLVYAVLKDVGIEELATRQLNQLSGGQQQMVSIAQSLAREPQVLLMDEPTSSLDLQKQMEIFDLIRVVTLERKMITLVAIHDLNLASRYADRIVIMNKGRVYATGTPIETLTPEMIKSVYGVRAEVHIDTDGLPVVIPKAAEKPRFRYESNYQSSKKVEP